MRKTIIFFLVRSFRKKYVFDEFIKEVKKINPRVTLISIAMPPTLLDFLWNRLHIMPVEKLTGPARRVLVQ